ncbi:hypothetical protein KGV52_00735 [Candidatus Gracilibacteria bacterium]|nr:hypothetical protein [Candidatus Gracilibacteria bacterium]
MILSVGVFLAYKTVKFILKKFEIQGNYTQDLLFIFGIIFTLSTPFIYERLMSQVHIAFGVFIFGLGFVYLLEFLEKDSKINSEGQKKNNIKLYLSSFFFALSVSIFPHASVFIFLIGVFTFLLFFKKFSFTNIFISLIIFLIFNINWLLGNFFLHREERFNVVNTISTLDMANVEGFTQNSLSIIGVELTSFFGYGFWGEKYGHIYTPDNFLNLWPLFAIIIFIIIFIGFSVLYKKDKKLCIYFGILYIVFFILALGISSSLFSWFNTFLFKNIPYYIGMREPGKFLGMLAIINIFLFLIGFWKVLLFLKKKNILDIENSKYDFSVVFIVMNLIFYAYNPAMLWGFKGQLQIVNFPQEYFESKKFLEEKNEKINLIFPWHSYVACEWGTGKISYNIYPNILDFSGTIQSDNIEIKTVYTNYNNPITKKVEKFLQTKDIKILQELGVQNIIFQDKCADYKNYRFLEKLDGLDKVFNKEYLKIYHIKYEKG